MFLKQLPVKTKIFFIFIHYRQFKPVFLFFINSFLEQNDLTCCFSSSEDVNLKEEEVCFSNIKD